MARTLRVREPSEEERGALERLAHSRTAAARVVERARVVWAVVQGERVEPVAARFQITAATVDLWGHRLSDGGVVGLEDKRRGGRPPTFTREQIGEVIATALTAPQTLGLPVTSWTLDRLAA
jgi:transposase